jgi:hypothetical protein
MKYSQAIGHVKMEWISKEQATFINTLYSDATHHVSSDDEFPKHQNSIPSSHS